MKNINPLFGALSFSASMLLVSFVIFNTAYAETLSRQLEVGMSGTDVSTLQTFLAQDAAIYPEKLVTGYFGPLTEAAVTRFQARNNISSVGRVGPITLSAINTQMNNGKAMSSSDKTSPVIGPVSVSVMNSGAMLKWNTSENVSAIIYYSSSPLVISEAGAGKGVNISGSTLLVSTELRNIHTATLTGLQSNTKYYYVVYVRDASGNVNITLPSTFQTSN